MIGSYACVTATTLNPGQDRPNLLQWHENGWIIYLECPDEVNDDRFGTTHI